MALLVKIKAALMCPTKLGVKVTTNWVLCPAASVNGTLRLLLKFESVCVSFEMVKPAEPVFVKVTVWLADWPIATPPYQMLGFEIVRILVWVEKAMLAVDIRKTAMVMLIGTSLPRALGESELMSAVLTVRATKEKVSGVHSQVALLTKVQSVALESPLLLRKNSLRPSAERLKILFLTAGLTRPGESFFFSRSDSHFSVLVGEFFNLQASIVR